MRHLTNLKTEPTYRLGFNTQLGEGYWEWVMEYSGCLIYSLGVYGVLVNLGRQTLVEPSYRHILIYQDGDAES